MITCGNCLPYLKQTPSASIDLAFTDPPYNAKKDYGVSNDDLNDEDYWNQMREVINELQRVTKRGFGLYTDWKHFQHFWQLIPEAEPIIIYKKSSGFIYSKHKVMQHHHIILTTATALKPVKSVWDDCRVFGEGYLFNEKKWGHPAQTSLKATRRFIEHFSNEDETILDPFMGVGTTAEACKQLKRNCVGYETNPQYIKTTEERLKQQVI